MRGREQRLGAPRVRFFAGAFIWVARPAGAEEIMG